GDAAMGMRTVVKRGHSFDSGCACSSRSWIVSISHVDLLALGAASQAGRQPGSSLLRHDPTDIAAAQRPFLAAPVGRNMNRPSNRTPMALFLANQTKIIRELSISPGTQALTGNLLRACQPSQILARGRPGSG